MTTRSRRGRVQTTVKTRDGATAIASRQVLKSTEPPVSTLTRDENDASEPRVLDSPRLLRLKAVLAKTGLVKSTAYGLMRAGAFPMPVSISRRSVGWVAGEIDDWIADRIRIRDQMATTRATASRDKTAKSA